MADRQDRAKCISKKSKYLRIWRLYEGNALLSIGSAMLGLLLLTSMPRSCLYNTRRQHGFLSSMFVLLDASSAGTHVPSEFPLLDRAGLEMDMESTADPDSVIHDMTPPTGCLAMIIKNEGPILPRLFESVRGFVSEYCIVDTGSTDDTIEVLRSMDMPGVILEELFVDFATTRNYMIHACRKIMTSCDYLILLDADMVLRVDAGWDWTKLDGRDVYNMVQISSVEYENVRMIRRDAQDIRVVGATHEYYDVPEKYTRGFLPRELIYIEDVGDGKAKGDKFERDERLLRRELEKDPDNGRAVFYLANTLKDQAKYTEAIYYYERRATMGGWFAETDYSRAMLSTCYLALDDLDNARKYGELAAFAGMVKRAEPLYFLAFHLRQHGQYKLAYYYATLAAKIPKPGVAHALFISYAIYDYWVDYELAALHRHVFPSQHLEGMDTALAFWNNVYAPEDLRMSFASIMKTYVQQNIISVSDERYHCHAASKAIPVAIFPRAGHIYLLHLKARQGVCSSVEIDLFNVDLQINSTRERGHVTCFTDTFASNHAISDGAWQFIGTTYVFGIFASVSDMYHGEWSKDRDHQVHLPLLVNNGQAAEQAKPWSVVENRGIVYCISKWHPAIEVGILRISSSDAVCEPHTSHSQVPRLFSFFRTTTHGVVHRGDFWFLLRVDSVDAFVMVVLGPDFTLKAFTKSFLMENEPPDGNEVNETYLGFDIVTQDDGQDRVVYVFTSEIGDVAIKQVPVEEILALMI